jgi:hypothetical protein
MQWKKCIEVIKATVLKYNEQNIQVVSKNLKNGYISIVNNTTNKILKPTTFIEPDLKTIINNHLKQ